MARRREGRMGGIASIALLPGGSVSGHFIQLPHSVCYGIHGSARPVAHVRASINASFLFRRVDFSRTGEGENAGVCRCRYLVAFRKSRRLEKAKTSPPSSFGTRKFFFRRHRSRSQRGQRERLCSSHAAIVDRWENRVRKSKQAADLPRQWRKACRRRSGFPVPLKEKKKKAVWKEEAARSFFLEISPPTKEFFPHRYKEHCRRSRFAMQRNVFVALCDHLAAGDRKYPDFCPKTRRLGSIGALPSTNIALPLRHHTRSRGRRRILRLSHVPCHSRS
ncbi:hypothetical protein KSP39_PZI010661 [Platanthera zijinensis]|uniref:Uncharacterized protein n=1 Tax=Platanthera zijinensis TaxID=2320716 RepID=A0AAP0BIT0_9ASPA